MSIKLLARDLYRYQQRMEALEKELAASDPAGRPQLAEQLRRVKSERDALRRALDGRIGR